MERNNKRLLQQESTSKNKQNSRIWHQVWDLNIKHKVKHFLWKCLHDILPTHDNIFKRTGKGEPWCRRCGESAETLEHLLFFCRTSEQIWKTFPIQWDGLEHLKGSFWSWWESLQQARERADGKAHIEMTTNLLWHIWKARNNWNFNLINQEGYRISQYAMADWFEFKEANLLNTCDKPENTSVLNSHDKTAELQQQHSTIIYTDAAVDQQRDKFGIGITARDNKGNLISTWSIPTSLKGEVATLEAHAIRTALLKALKENWTSILLLSDCKVLVDKLNHWSEDLSDINIILRDIKTLSSSFWRCTFSFVKREINTCSYGLAKFATNLVNETRWKNSFPVWTSTAAQTDYLAVAS
ncbi:uncharacterized protein LOC113759492 [Coffea eugenioides]|uniref:uncharacterized protein LOC113759492 n=1 Tax=Coffea eugenioides TaxID=49369 RepID=UPI000F6075FC|nr:uncharacterized protein LOC113759492 [Coffea eugenioides]